MPSTTTTTPPGYIAPRFPGLYWPVNTPLGAPQYLYHATDIWRFTLYWTLLFYLPSHLLVAFFAVGTQLLSASKTHPPSVSFSLKWVWAVPLIYGTLGGIEALLAGSMVGLVLGAVYSAGYYKMSTWVPFLWGGINVLVLVVSSFSIQGGL